MESPDVKITDGIADITIPYSPRPHQLYLHTNLKRFNVIVLPRRTGKSYFALNELVRKALQITRPFPTGRFAYISPQLKQTKRNIWDIMKYYTKSIPGIKYNEAELSVRFPNGAIIYLLQGSDYDSLRGLHLDGVVIDEVEQIPEEAWTEVIRPALSDYKGWAVFIGTPKGQNTFYRLYMSAKGRKDWFRARFTSTQLVEYCEKNNVPYYVTPEELADALEDMGQALYDQEYNCSFTSALRGSFYGELLQNAKVEGRIDTVAWDPALPVTTSWDLGHLDPTCIWFAQVKNNQIYLIDYYQGHSPHPEAYAKVLTDKPYQYKEHIIPHDSDQHRLGMPNSVFEQLNHLLNKKCTFQKRSNVDEGIHMVRSILPRCHFDSNKCELGLEALSNYRSEFKSIRGVYGEKPVKDWSTHASDAFRYLARGIKDNTDHKIPPRFLKSNYDPFARQIVDEYKHDPFRSM